MPWRGVTVSEQRERFLEDYRLNYYSLSDLAERFNISRKTAAMPKKPQNCRNFGFRRNCALEASSTKTLAQSTCTRSVSPSKLNRASSMAANTSP